MLSPASSQRFLPSIAMIIIASPNSGSDYAVSALVRSLPPLLCCDHLYRGLQPQAWQCCSHWSRQLWSRSRSAAIFGRRAIPKRWRRRQQKHRQRARCIQGAWRKYKLRYTCLVTCAAVTMDAFFFFSFQELLYVIIPGSALIRYEPPACSLFFPFLIRYEPPACSLFFPFRTPSSRRGTLYRPHLHNLLPRFL